MKPLADMTYLEAEEAFKKTDIAIVAVGALEQHGPHLALGTDNILSCEVAKRVAEKTDIIFPPCIGYGYVADSMDFPGTIGVGHRVLTDFVKDILRGLIHHGIKKVVLIGGHGGNEYSMFLAAREIKEETGAFIVIPKLNKIGVLFSGHGGAEAVAVNRYLRPDIVVDDTKAKGAYEIPKKPLWGSDRIIARKHFTAEFKGVPLTTPLDAKEISKSGVMLRTEEFEEPAPIESGTPEQGEKIVNGIVNFLVDLVEEMKKMKVG